MTNKEAKDVLQHLRDSDDSKVYQYDAEIEALDMAIKALEAQDTKSIKVSIDEKVLKKLTDEAVQKGIEEIRQEALCLDAISRQVLLNYIRDNHRRWFINDDAFIQCVNGIKDITHVIPKQRTGHWIECEDEVKCFCSECKEISDYPTKFCPHCGAKMVKPQENCDTCKHKDEEWDSEHCDGCCVNHSGFEPQESEEQA